VCHIFYCCAKSIRLSVVKPNDIMLSVAAPSRNGRKFRAAIEIAIKTWAATATGVGVGWVWGVAGGGGPVGNAKSPFTLVNYN
jgi:hypothetical protein